MWRIRIPTETLKDERHKKVVFLSHCILNENTRYLGGAFCPGALTDVVSKWMNKGVGIVQMPCPEQHAWGGVNKTWMWLAYASKGTLREHVSIIMLPAFLLYTRLRYKRIARDVCNRMKDYRKAGYEIVGVVGIDGSPTCGVRESLSMRRSTGYFARQEWTTTREAFNEGMYRECAVQEEGMYFRELHRRMTSAHMEIPVDAVSLAEEMRESKRPTINTRRNIYGIYTGNLPVS